MRTERRTMSLPNRQQDKRRLEDIAKKVAPKRWSHQDDLAAMKGKTVLVQSCNGHDELGTLLEADQFTIKIQRLGNENAAVILFKSEIRSIEESLTRV